MNRMKRNSLGQTGMTMLELVAVIAIFGVLVAILFVVFLQARNIITTTSASRQVQSVLLELRRDAIDTSIPDAFPHTNSENYNLEYYELIIDFNGDDFARRGVMTNLTNGLTEKFPNGIDYEKKNEYERVEINPSSCGNVSATGQVYVTFDALTGEMNFFNSSLHGGDPSHGSWMNIGQCVIEFTTENGTSRLLYIDREERTFKRSDS